MDTPHFPANTVLFANGTGENLCVSEALTGTCEEVYNSPWSRNAGQLSLLGDFEEADSDSCPLMDSADQHSIFPFVSDL